MAGKYISDARQQGSEKAERNPHPLVYRSHCIYIHSVRKTGFDTPARKIRIKVAKRIASVYNLLLLYKIMFE